MDGRITLQINRYLQEHPEYTYSGIKRTLEYFYKIKKNPIEKANGGIGIVPWVYEEAKRYYYNQWLLSQKNAEKNKRTNNMGKINVNCYNNSRDLNNSNVELMTIEETQQLCAKMLEKIKKVLELVKQATTNE